MVVRGVVIMLDITEMKKLLKASLPHKRFKHSLAVYDTALELAAVYGLDKEKVGVGALLHDCGREIPTRDLLMHTIALGLPMDNVERNQPILLHAKLGVYYAREKYGVTDQEILDAIRFHTTGAAGMSKMAMVVYLADLLEPTRDFAGIEEMRRLAKVDLEQAMIKAYAQTIRYLLEYDLLVHPHCIEGYNELAAKFKRLKLNL